MIYDCIIIGAGAAGLFCSASFSAPVRGLILEKSRRPAAKLLMSGGGQCNITHGGSIKDFPDRYGANGKKIRTCLYKYHNQMLMDFLSENGVPTTIREDGKVFPVSMQARDVRDLLLRLTAENGFEIRCSASVSSITKVSESNARDPQAESLWQIETEDGFSCRSRNLIIAAGGCSYPSTGSDGSIFSILRKQLQLEIVPLRPALTPVFAADYPYSAQSGIAFPAACVQIWRAPDGSPEKEKRAVAGIPDGFRKITQKTGPLLLTHENFSGPLILNLSKEIRKNDRIVINYLYPCDKKEVLEKINRTAAHSRKQMPNLLAREFCLPKSFVTEILKSAGNQPKAAAAKLTEDTFTVTHLSGYNKAMVTAGGVSLTEITPGTMECKKHPRLYIIGETLDIDGETGGYNLQFAYSSACAAAASVSADSKGGNHAHTR